VRIGWFDCGSGISGDMTLGALVSAGWPAERLESLPGRLGLEGVRVAVSEVRRGPLAAVRVEVRVEEAVQPHRHLGQVEAVLGRADLPEPVRGRASAVFRRLAEAEAAVHGTSVEKVHFHEVGAADALVDVTGAALGLAELGVERVYASAPRLGRGSVPSAHGTIPVPAPATAQLLRGAPVEIGEACGEMTTPTGAALLATFVDGWEAPPAFRLEQVGTGAGSRDVPGLPNVLRLFLGSADLAPAAGGLRRRRVAVLETALDDENPQFAGALLPRLLAAGALDAMIVPSVMKKGRPGMWLVAVADPHRAGDLAAMILAGTTSLGVRMRVDERLELERRGAEVETPFGSITIKIATLPDGTERAAPEFESVREAAERAGRPLREVAEAAMAAWRGRAGGGR
jgi:pyridinium-3,5-bisthiocarboxylic acid mononucleotide nickel chelatase